MRSSPRDDHDGALAWALEPKSAKIRGNRFLAFVIAANGSEKIDGARTIREAAFLRGVSHSTIFELIRVYRTRFGIRPKRASLPFEHKSLSGEVMVPPDEGDNLDEAFPFNDVPESVFPMSQ